MTADWAVESLMYLDSASISRDALQDSFEQHWPEGQAHMAEICGYHYEKESLLAPDEAEPQEEGSAPIAARGSPSEQRRESSAPMAARDSTAEPRPEGSALHGGESCTAEPRREGSALHGG